MRLEYRIIATMTFDNPEDRQVWYDAIKTAVINAKPSKPAYRQAHMTKDEYNVPEPLTEAI
jgi:hypothetical protein